MKSWIGRLGRLFCWAVMGGMLCAWAVVEARGAGPRVTTVADIVYRADGKPATGWLVISWQSFVTADGSAVAAGTKTVQLGADGSFTATLAPNAGATPAGSYYSVTIKLDGGPSSKEAWLVPVDSPVTLAKVRATEVPATMAVQTVSADWANANFVSLAGAQTVTGAKSFAISPAVPDPVKATDAASKKYVDANSVGGPDVARVDVAQTWTQPQTFKSVNGRFDLGSFGASNAAGDCDAAAALGPRAVIEADPQLGNGACAQLNSNTRVVDYRGNSEPDQYGQSGTGTSSGYVNGILFRATETQPANPVYEHGFSNVHFHYTPLAGGQQTYTGSSGTKTDYANIHLTLEARTIGQRWNEWAQQSCFGGGDCAGTGHFVTYYGGYLNQGDEQSEAGRFETDQGSKIFTASNVRVSGNVLSYSGATWGQTIGEQRLVIDTTTAYATGTIVGIAGMPPVITGSGTAWQSQFGVGTVVAFCADWRAGTAGQKFCVPAQINSDTQATVTSGEGIAPAFSFPETGPTVWAGTATGSYHMYRGAMATGVSPNMADGVAGASGTITVSDGSQFTNASNIEMELAYNGVPTGARVVVNPAFDLNGGNYGHGLLVVNSSSRAVRSLVDVEGPATYGVLLGGQTTAGMRVATEPTLGWLYSMSTSGASNLVYVSNGSGQARTINYNRSSDLLNIFGTLQLNVDDGTTTAAVVSGGLTFTVGSGCGTTSQVTGGATSGSFVAGQAACAPVINLPAAPHGWACSASDVTHAAAMAQSGTSANSCTVTGTVTSGDVIVFQAMGY